MLSYSSFITFPMRTISTSIEIVVFGFMLIIHNPTALSQENVFFKNKLQVNFGLSKTLHYNQPVTFVECIEGCRATGQTARMSKNLGLSFYKSINSANDIIIGMGFSQYRFTEKGFYSPGDGTFLPYTVAIGFNYFDFVLGHRVIFFKNWRIRPYFESNVIYELLFQDDSDYSYSFKSGGFSTMLKTGLKMDISKSLYLSLNAFYKTAFTKYNSRKEKYIEKYVPYGYGTEIGIGVKF